MNQSLRKEAWQILITTEAKHTDVKDTSLCVNTIADMLFFFSWLTDSVGENQKFNII